MIERQPIEHVALEHFREQGRLFAILDACDSPSIPVLCAGLGESRAVSLYRGTAEEQFADIAPYLVHVDTAELLDWVLQFSVTPGWGIMIVASGTLEQLRTHFRKFLKVQGPDGKPMYFRFYDPRVLEMFLPTCNTEQLIQLYGPAELFATRDGAQPIIASRRAGSVLNPVAQPK